MTVTPLIILRPGGQWSMDTVPTMTTHTWGFAQVGWSHSGSIQQAEKEDLVIDLEPPRRLMRTDILVPLLLIPPLHRDSSFLYEVTGSNPSRAINSVHPRQARCLSILRKFRHNIREEERAGRRTADTKLVILEQIHLNKHCLLRSHWIYLWINCSHPVQCFGEVCQGWSQQRRVMIWPHVWCYTAPVWLKCATVNFLRSSRFITVTVKTELVPFCEEPSPSSDLNSVK